MLVKPTATHGRVVLWDKHPDYPSGEVFIKADGAVYDVALTAAVQARIDSGELQVVKDTTDIETLIVEPPVQPQEQQEPRRRGRPRKFIGSSDEDE